jgi:hypothetical protein
MCSQLAIAQQTHFFLNSASQFITKASGTVSVEEYTPEIKKRWPSEVTSNKDPRIVMFGTEKSARGFPSESPVHFLCTSAAIMLFCCGEN